MASTRNKNTIGNYNLEQRDNCLINNYDLYKYGQSGRAYHDALPCIGYNPSYMSRDSFSYNSVDIESALYGINSTNLVCPQAPVKPELKTLSTYSYFNKIPLIMPAPLVIEKSQRPFPVPQ
jgi:hypothetical protein